MREAITMDCTSMCFFINHAATGIFFFHPYMLITRYFSYKINLFAHIRIKMALLKSTG